ncbi:DNA-directed RNA polymerase subunit delta [Enterococcus faecalis]|uniref:DNA-directed RNA polymerase subunit delta n=1 Tax=Enterococcus faecalis TaxID=1351 RepID=UPI001780129F|nr:DNA-directed RNA polymerase subunit delta [Enterococcus faecalis]EKJ5004588.1 DNA-directed RNA polymerase subunit delta [Enterococcus faecalis]EKO5667114.1 DNA-directed RNA polymerase subunit delta [Enterococcus faecalis]EME3230506.1 DNA-directed RNA polymerase subunit delta [Enterococcus faecalis]MBD9945031.1 DNA-directed RNA polymerase subunit delta [Enterococcus faecalis]MBD9950317.1 DNA-directed RNA polymerase subunit delta [Enterococcus faecalis]
MKLYRYESSKNTGRWTESLIQATKEFEDEKDYLMADDPEEDETVKLVSIEIPDDLIDERKELKEAILMHDPARLDENPREDGYDFDFYAAWSDDIAKR